MILCSDKVSNPITFDSNKIDICRNNTTACYVDPHDISAFLNNYKGHIGDKARNFDLSNFDLSNFNFEYC